MANPAVKRRALLQEYPMSAIGAVSAAAQAAQASQAIKPVDRDGDHDNNKPDPALEQAKEGRAVGQHKVNVEA
jgi:hypothetical protein